jgi:hypothetical protein
LSENPFTRFRDSMNGYALVRARFPNKILSPYIYNSEPNFSTLKEIQAMIMGFKFHREEQEDGAETEEEEDEGDNGDSEESGNEEDNEINADNEPEVDIVNNDTMEVGSSPPPNDDDDDYYVPNSPPPIDHDDDDNVPNRVVRLFEETETEVILRIPELLFNENWFEFNHHWRFQQQYPDNIYPLYELDDLPDPRLYGIDVKQLRNLARRQCSDCGGPFDPSYEAYLINVEPVRLTTMMMDNYVTNYGVIVETSLLNLLTTKFRKLNPIRFFSTMLDFNLDRRKQQINRALNKFVIALDVAIEGKTWYDTLDNIYWGIGTGDPTPKLVWLRYLRWRRYFLHLKLSGITRTMPDTESIQFGPPNLRLCDKQRMELTNCLALDFDAGQFASNSVGCHHASDPGSPFPKFPNVKEERIILYQYKSIWTMDLNDFDCRASWNHTFKLLNRPYTQLRPPSLRQDKLLKFLQRRRPEWGSKSSEATAEDNNAEDWFTGDVYYEHYAERDNNGWQDERPTKQQKLDKDEM